MGFHCPKRFRQLRLTQYSKTEEQRRHLPLHLTQNKFRKAAWKLWQLTRPSDLFTNKVCCAS